MKNINKIVLILGASSDIGEYYANYYSNLGYIVVLTYNNSYKEVLNLYNSIKQKTEVSMYKVSANIEEEIKNLFKNIIDKYGNIDIVINLVATYNDNIITEKTKKDFINIIDVNIGSAYLICKYSKIYLNNSLIINMSSTDGIDTYNEYNIDYAVSKSGIITLNKAMSLIDKSNKYLCIAPNWINTRSTREIDKTFLDNELKRIGQTRLIEINELINTISEIINNFESGSCYRIDIKDDKLWIKLI